MAAIDWLERKTLARDAHGPDLGSELAFCSGEHVRLISNRIQRPERQEQRPLCAAEERGPREEENAARHSGQRVGTSMGFGTIRAQRAQAKVSSIARCRGTTALKPSNLWAFSVLTLAEIGSTRNRSDSADN